MRVCGPSAFQKRCNSVQIRLGLQLFNSKNRMAVEHRRWVPVIAARRRAAASWSLFQRAARSCQNSQFRALRSIALPPASLDITQPAYGSDAGPNLCDRKT